MKKNMHVPGLQSLTSPQVEIKTLGVKNKDKYKRLEVVTLYSKINCSNSLEHAQEVDRVG